MEYRQEDVSVCCICSFILLIIFGDINYILNVIKKSFYNFNDNGRFELWQSGLNFWRKDFISMTFGMGQVAEIRWWGSFHGEQYINMVYHSTIIHCMTTMGNMGLGFLILHFIDKYKQLFKLSSGIAGVMLIGYVMVDLYGMIDNTYGMYYYMIPLMIIMATLDQIGKEDIKDLF